MKTSTITAVKRVSKARLAASLHLYLETLIYKTRERLELINITKDLNEVVRKHGLKAGFVLVQSLHTTTAVFINEFQQALLDDMKSFLERLVGRIEYWRHNDPRLSECSRKNADSHLRAMVLGHTVSLPVANGELALGTWQSVILAELDGPRERAIQVQVLGVEEEPPLSPRSLSPRNRPSRFLPFSFVRKRRLCGPLACVPGAGALTCPVGPLKIACATPRRDSWLPGGGTF